MTDDDFKEFSLSLRRNMRENRKERHETRKHQRTLSLQNKGIVAGLPRFLGTLSLGAIALILGFLENLSKFVHKEIFLVTVVLLFFCCIVSSAYSYALIVGAIEGTRKNASSAGKWYYRHNLVLKVSLWTFVLGVTFLTAFVLFNTFSVELVQES